MTIVLENFTICFLLMRLTLPPSGDSWFHSGKPFVEIKQQNAERTESSQNIAECGAGNPTANLDATARNGSLAAESTNRTYLQAAPGVKLSAL